MKEILFADLDEVLAPCRQAFPPRHFGDGSLRRIEPMQSFEEYRFSRPARQTARRKALYLSRIGALTAAQERIVSATGVYLSVFFALPVRSGESFDPAVFPSFAVRDHPLSRHRQLLTHHLVNEVLWLDRPEEALICLGATAWDLWSIDGDGSDWISVPGEAFGGHAGVWSLYCPGDPGGSEQAYRRGLRRSFATAAHEAAHVLGLDHCTGALCLMNRSTCLREVGSQPLHLCPLCLRKLCWNRQVDLLPYLQQLRDFVGRFGFSDTAELYERMIRLLGSGRRDRDGSGNDRNRLRAGPEAAAPSGTSRTASRRRHWP